MDSGEDRSSSGPTHPVNLAAHIAAAWSEVLGGIPVSEEDDFFDLGGHSLAIASVAARIRSSCGVDISFGAFFDHPTAELLAAAVQPSGPPKADIPPPPEPGRTSWTRTVSVTQEHRLLFNRRMADGRTQPVCHTYLIEGPLDTARLAAALSALVARHDALRMVFPYDPDQPLRAELTDAAQACWPLRELTLSHLPSEKRAEEAQRLLEEFCDAPFDLADGPLTSALVLHLEADRHVLALGLEHLVCDGESFGRLMAELPELYEHPTAAVTAPEEADRRSYTSYLQAQLSELQPDSGTGAVAHWQREFDRHGMFPPRLRPDAALADDPLATGASSCVSVPVPEEVARLVPEAAASRHATPFMLYLTAVLRGLRPRVESDWIGAAFMEAGRRELRAQDLVGNLAHELQVWCRVPPEAGAESLLGQVRERVAESVRHSLPLWWMVRRYRSAEGAAQSFDPSRLDERFAVPWLYFSYQDGGGVRPELPGLRISPYPRRTEIPHMRTPVFMVTAARTAEGAVLSCDFAAGGYRPEAVREVLEASVRTLAELVGRQLPYGAQEAGS